MIDGIDYYPQQKKRRNKKGFIKLTIILLLVLITLIVAYYLFYDEKIPKKPNISSIVIKEPETEKTKVVPIIKMRKVQPKESETLEYLDEII
ncbi:hypothetical protein BTHERMOSOX_589 [Bathymodiolus thermophilus thioautotrophic gill symbiont]|uniref:Uncharacterized protein n=1 Tax=Bathymodiolus thermophilus thioautotrophic gill symbiont TaxID=2360 RepID=A0A3G3INV4_9GAMM|nr:hypothetical protein [Bathymodiolus thermophilus thioautotrophic gill symbiont]AYQ57152.1 hypothetical protein MS2017_1466 [Bathymodiolus thermophilus thioautotrophic gill symbiont]CAB5498127.1 hypothetical protein THERMOS_789 [Bathymodiolus thermophilus thioautotrophic gill symbiont]SGZ72347.1 hypothetical protein BTHERMOSOX_589 [Bathymodiolus thermophilus thioautotrophic gill symbiont]